MAYATEAKMNFLFGSLAVTAWADKDRNAAADTGAVADHLAEGDRYINRAFRPSRYRVPLEQKSSSSAPDDIVTLASKYAGWSLWFHSGRTGNQVAFMDKVKEDVDLEIAKILKNGSLDAKEN